MDQESIPSTNETFWKNRKQYVILYFFADYKVDCYYFIINKINCTHPQYDMVLKMTIIIDTDVS